MIVAVSPAMRLVTALCDQYAGLPDPVLVSGETGTGKELIARRLHMRGPHQDRPLVVVNCAAIPAELFEREMFGHARGAYTGADIDVAGFVEQGEGGTLVLDEVGELPLALQSKLLRLLEDGSFNRLGDPSSRRATIRLVSVTNALLPRLVEEGRFRSDLFYRMRGLEIMIPSLRKRRSDIVPLFEHFLSQIEAQPLSVHDVLTPAELQRLKRLPLPGNARELQQLARRTLLAGALPPTDDPDGVESTRTIIDADVSRSERPSVHDLREMLRRCDGNKAMLSRQLGISRSTLYRWLQ